MLPAPDAGFILSVCHQTVKLVLLDKLFKVELIPFILSPLLGLINSPPAVIIPPLTSAKDRVVPAVGVNCQFHPPPTILNPEPNGVNVAALCPLSVLNRGFKSTKFVTFALPPNG